MRAQSRASTRAAGACLIAEASQPGAFGKGGIVALAAADDLEANGVESESVVSPEEEDTTPSRELDGETGGGSMASLFATGPARMAE